MTTNHIPNRLIAEKSPYLLQHTHNPVNWYAWSEEAFNEEKISLFSYLLGIADVDDTYVHVIDGMFV
ncbi:DUF255 domain-containing protein [Paenibacillus profundus]|uniref:DUF255 domain-containing protein n=1 Tax=Paenibacillus profundus TaxID=1173085 RepID=UPI00389952CB